MSADDLIKNLAKDLKPVEKQPSPNAFAIKYLIILFLIIAVGLISLRMRNDLQAEIKDIKFILDFSLNVLVLLSGIFLTAWFSTAGRKYNQNLKYILFFLFILILGFNSYRLSIATVYFKNMVVNIFDIKCFVIVMFFSLMSTLIMTIAISKRIVFNPGLVGTFVGLLSFSVGSFIINMHCPISAELHVTLFHTLLPMLIGSTVGFFSGKIFFKI